MKKYCVEGGKFQILKIFVDIVPQVAEDLRAISAMKKLLTMLKRRFLQLISMRLQTTEEDMF